MLVILKASLVYCRSLMYVTGLLYLLYIYQGHTTFQNGVFSSVYLTILKALTHGKIMSEAALQIIRKSIIYIYIISTTTWNHQLSLS